MDTAILQWVHGLATPALDLAFRFSNLFGLFPVCAAFVAAMAGFHLLRREPRHAVVWLVVGAATAVVPQLVKELVARPRPDLWATLVHGSGYSFPSGHAVASAAFYPLAGWLVPRRARASRVGFALGAAFALFVGVGRVYLGVHWPSDVLAGWALGFALSALAIRVLARGRRPLGTLAGGPQTGRAGVTAPPARPAP